MNSILATIHSREENEFVSSLTDGYAWIGASDTVLEGSWVWMDGENWGGYINWSGNNPDNSRGQEHCALITSGQWNDVSCSLGRPYVCKTKN